MTDQQPKAQIAIKCLIKLNSVFIGQLIHLINYYWTSVHARYCTKGSVFIGQLIHLINYYWTSVRARYCTKGWWRLITQLCLILCDPTDCSLPGSSVHGIFQARILESGAIPFSRGSFWPRDQTWVSYLAGRFFTNWVTVKQITLGPCPPPALPRTLRTAKVK